jgi:hypothetical protein
MSKPIFIVRFPKGTDVEHLQNAAEQMGRNGVYNDYHILVIKDEFTGGEIKFECFNSPHTEIEFKELQNRVISLLSKNEANK